MSKVFQGYCEDIRTALEDIRKRRRLDNSARLIELRLQDIEHFKDDGREYTKEDHDNLADIIWWIKGYIAGARDNHEECPFSEAHAESLRRARVILEGRIYKEISNESKVSDA